MIDETKIMQYVDGTLPTEEKEAVEKAIETNPKFKKLLQDYQETADVLFNLGKSIKSQPLPYSLKKKLKEINSWEKSYVKKDKLGFFEAIFQKPIRNFIAYPIAAVFVFTFGFQMNNYLAKTITAGKVKVVKEEATQEIKLARMEAVQEIKLAIMEAENKIKLASIKAKKEKEKAVKIAKTARPEYKVFRKELEEQKKQVEALQAEIIDLRIKLKEATTYYYKNE